ncbi:DUF3343 domain-containing protein [Bilifractor porci]|jgi:hypothetical protein|uniref:DUF3343 domain-containing protein n=1 Tax=Bilifractor porci TaxID=2606636 RepID=A0A7X2P772_9FIRM|nr:DUF3343 domain-containing protein [Bilifractor porci]MST81499.1 DUF3343 domain-containing protein [Bilifractor porci]
MEQLIVSFHTATEAMEVEDICREQKISGRLIPVPPDIKADCGLAWRTEPGNRELLQKALEGKVVPAGWNLRECRY